MSALTWPDLVIGAIALLAFLKGWKRGFVRELAGAVALIVALWAAFAYPGGWDRSVAHATHLGPGSAHVVAMVLYAAVAYLVVSAIAWILGRFARLAVIGAGNALAGGLVGLGKALILLWAVLYVALFFPLSRDLRGDLRRSTLVAILTSPNERVDGVVRGTLPWFVRPYANPLFEKHRV